jgi:ABC-type multidrug transport system ATPase subunit
MLRSFLQQLATSNRTVILTTHNLEQGLEMCSRAAILDRGRIAWQGARAEIDLESMKEIYRQCTMRNAPGTSDRRGTGTAHDSEPTGRI